ncbi:MAG: DUF3185 family protein [Stenotrophobium sp.]
MNKAISVGLIIGGAVLIIWGFNVLHSFDSKVSQFFSNTPSDKAIWLFVSGTVLAIAGLIGALRKGD